MSVKRNAAAAGVLLLIGIMFQVLFDPLSSVEHSIEIARVRSGFPDARAKWAAQNITDYNFEIRGSAPLICSPYAIIEVKDDAVVRVGTKDLFSEDSPAQGLPPEKWADPDWGNEVFLCDYANFTMTRIFELLERTLQDNPSTILKADFDPNYGFVTSFSYGLFVGRGLLSPRIRDDSDSFRIEKFQPLVHEVTP